MRRIRGSPLLEIGALLFSVIVFFAAAAVINFVFRDPEAPIRHAQLAELARLAVAPPGSVTLSRAATERTIAGSSHVADFLTLLVEPADIPRHHTHPEDDIRIHLADMPEVYLLGRDSAVPYEYWLQSIEPDGTVRTLKLFRSEALNAWLLQHGFITRIRH
jgi:hypothetical protein